jgi:Methyltransferase domain
LFENYGQRDDQQSEIGPAMVCKICGTTTTLLGTATVLDKHSVRYFLCPNCAFVQTEDPYWLSEAYSDAITKTDIGLVGRNVSLAAQTKLLILAYFDHRQKFLDYGGGYGMYVRLMRDAGFDFYLYDQYCENLFAKGFSIDEAGNDRYELVTAFEVFEHLVNPMTDIERMLRFAPNVIFTTGLINSPPPLPGDWWYYGLEHGQHVALYSQKTLSYIAEHFGLHLLTDNHSLHLLTARPLPAWKFRAFQNRWGRLVSKGWLGRKMAGRSLLAADYEKLAGRPLR